MSTLWSKFTELFKTKSLTVRKVPLKNSDLNVKGCRGFSYGRESTKRNRTIMVLGATGAGKSTLINGMINYILGVKWENSHRFILVHEDQATSQAESQTSEVTVYKINHQEGFKINHSLTIIDTPGFGDTRGIDRDKLITEQLRNLFSDHHGVTEIDAVCFVVQSALARLTPTQKYVFDSILSIFGKDVAENIRILVTFADGQQPPVLEAIKASDVPCPKTDDGLPVHFKFNNSALFVDNKSSVTNNTGDEDEDGGFDQMFWNMGTKSMKRFFAALNVIKAKSWKLTKELLNEKQQLKVSLENLQKQIKVGLDKMEEIKEKTKKLKDDETEINTKVVHGDGIFYAFLNQEFLKIKMTVQAEIINLQAEYDRLQTEMVKLIEKSSKCLNRLKEISLKPNPLSTPDYIDMMIEGEKSEGKPGWKE